MLFCVLNCTIPEHVALFFVVVFFLMYRLVVEEHLPRIKNVVALQTVMRLLGKDMSLDLKRKLEVCFPLLLP